MKETIEMKEMKDLRGPAPILNPERNERNNWNEIYNFIEMKEMKDLRSPLHI
jgi:hypothetical protein